MCLTGDLIRGKTKIDPNTNWEAIFGTALGFLSVITLIGLLSQIWILQSVEIDERSKKVRVRIFRFDKIIDKGEYDINDNLKVYVNAMKKGGGTYNLVFKYGKKKIWSETISGGLMRFSGWTTQMFKEVVNAIDNLR